MKENGVLYHPVGKLKRSMQKCFRNFGYELEKGFSLRTPFTNRYFSFKHAPVPFTTKKPYTEPFEVPIDLISTRVAFSFEKDRYHPFVATLEQYQQNPTLRYEDSELKRLYENFKPASVGDVLFRGDENTATCFHEWPADIFLLTNIWTLTKPAFNTRLEKTRALKNRTSGWILYGPNTDAFGKGEFERLLSVYNSIKENGYEAKMQSNSIDGYFLKAADQVKFVLLQGNHRVAALKALGHEKVTAVIREGHPFLIERENLGEWVLKNKPPFNETDALRLFDALFVGYVK